MNTPRKMLPYALSSILIICAIVGFSQVTSLYAQNITYHGITVEEDDTTIIDGENLIFTGNITIRDNGILILRNSYIQLSIRGEKDYNVSISGDGILLLEKSELTSFSTDSKIFLSEKANLTVKSGSKVKGFTKLNSTGNASITIVDGKLEVDEISGKLHTFILKNTEQSTGVIHVETELVSVNNFQGQDVRINCTEADLIGSIFTSLTMNATENLNILKMVSSEASLATAGDFRIENGTIDKLTLQGNGEVYNVVTKSGPTPIAGGQIFVRSNSTILRYWYLTVTVTDVIGVTIPADISLYDINGTETLQVKADILGRAYTPVLAEQLNASKTIFVGNYKIKASYMNQVSPIKTLTMDMNRHLDLTFSDVIPIPTATYLQLSDLNVRVGSKITISGWIIPRFDGETIEITYTNPQKMKSGKVLKTLDDGTFTDEFVPDIAGDWFIYAEWLGGSQYVDDQLTTSRPINFVVNEKPSLQVILIRILPIFIIIIVIVIAVAYLAINSSKKSKALQLLKKRKT